MMELMHFPVLLTGIGVIDAPLFTSVPQITGGPRVGHGGGCCCSYPSSSGLGPRSQPSPSCQEDLDIDDGHDNERDEKGSGRGVDDESLL